MDDELTHVLDGSTFVLGDRRGDVLPGTTHGLFYRDTRHLSQWELTIDGRRPNVVQAFEVEYDEAVFALAEETGTVYQDAQVSVLRRRCVAGGMAETVEVSNHARRRRALTVSVLFDADFADVFDVKDQRSRPHRRPAEVGDDEVRLCYEREGYRRETVIRAPGARCTSRSVEFTITLEPQESASLRIEVDLLAQGRRTRIRSGRRPNMERSLREWVESAPRLETDWDALRHTYDRSLVDLAALRFYPDGAERGSVPAAGLPWYMALFGRDSLLTSYLALPYLPELCATTLQVLAERQATTVDDVRDSEPGKILHELRHGESAWFGDRPESPYYGTADATALFLVVLDAYDRWTGDAALVARLEPAARAALGWLEHFADSTGDGYVDYATRNPRTGIENQCWKDSPGSVVHPDGSLASLPRATCELQGYAYDARLRAARLARERWGDAGTADRLERDAAALRDRFLRDYWIDDLGWFALALDGEGRQVRTLTSNIGHLLWSGIVDEGRARLVADALLSGPLFSGWGVRTLAAGQTAYNPVGYHVGSVWPHDNALIVEGLARYGRQADSDRIAAALLEAAGHLGHRLPEALAGHDRDRTHGRPLRYPSAASPQAWASAAPLHLLTVMLGLRPDRRTGTRAVRTSGGPRTIALLRPGGSGAP